MDQVLSQKKKKNGFLICGSTKWPASSWLGNSVGRALQQYHRGHEFESCSGQNFFQALISELLKFCIISWYHSPQFRCMKFHIFTCILHLLWVYYELTKWPALSWLDSSVGRALHWYCRGNGFEFFLGFTFTTASVVCITAMINRIFIIMLCVSC